MFQMNQHLNILDVTLLSMARRWPSHLFVWGIISIVVFMVSSLLMMVSALRHESAEILKAAPDITVIQYALGRQVPIEKNKVDIIRNIPGVTSVSYRSWGYYNDPYTNANFTVWAIPAGTEHQLKNLDLLFSQGGFWDDGEQGKVVIGDGVSKALNLNDRKNFSLNNARGELVNFYTSGIFSTSSSLLTADLILMEEHDFHHFYRLPLHLATDIAVYAANPTEIPVISQKIQKHLPACRSLLKSQLHQTYAAVFNHRAGLLLYAWAGCLGAFLLVLWLKGRHPSGEEQKELGLLKALGWSTGDVLEMKLFEALVVSLLSAATGYGLAYVHIYLFNAPFFKPVLFGWSVLYPDFQLVPMLSVGQLLFILLLVSLPYIGITLMASWKSVSVDTASLLMGDNQ